MTSLPAGMIPLSASLETNGIRGSVHDAFELREGFDEQRCVDLIGATKSSAAHAFEHHRELVSQLFVLPTELINNRGQRRFGLTERREEVLVFGLVMLVEQFRVVVERPEQLAVGLLVERGRQSESRELRVIPMELIVRGLERRDDRALTSEVDETLKYRARVVVEGSAAGRHARDMYFVSRRSATEWLPAPSAWCIGKWPVGRSSTMKPSARSG